VEEFNPISIGERDIAGMTTIQKSVRDDEFKDDGVVVIDPLWVPIHNVISSPEKNDGETTSCSGTKEYYGRFFLKSLEPTDIDYEVLGGR